MKNEEVPGGAEKLYCMARGGARCKMVNRLFAAFRHAVKFEALNHPNLCSLPQLIILLFFLMLEKRQST